MATLPGLNKGVTKDPTPPATDTVLSPITIPDDTILVTTKTTNETIDNVDQLIDYVSGDNSPNFIPQQAIENLVSDLAAKENALGFTPENIANKVTFVGTPGNDTNYPTEKAVRDGLDLKEDSLGFTPEDSANKGAASGYAGLVASQLLLTNFPSGAALEVLRRNAANDALEFVASSSSIESLTDTTITSVAANEGLVRNAGNTTWINALIADANIDGAAAIAQSKLNLSITNAELATGVFAAITGLGVQTQDLDMGVGGIVFSADTPGISGALKYIANEFASLFINSETGSQIDFAINNVSMATVELNRLDLGNTTDILGALNIQFGNSETNPDNFLRYIQYGTTQGFRINAAAADIIHLSNDGTSEYGFSATQADFNSNNLINLGTLNTHTIPGGTDTFAMLTTSQTLTNKTIDGDNNTISNLVIGAEVTGASTALTDTADIAYLNTANTYIAGVRQDFLGLLAGTAGLNVGGIAGDPTAQVDGDIWLNTTSNILFARISGVDVDLGAGGGSGITTINGDPTAAQIIDTGTGLGIVNVDETHTLSIDSTVATLTGSQTLTNKTIDGNSNTILNINETQLTVSSGVGGTVLTSNGVGMSPTYELAGTGDVVGPASATVNAIARFDTASGKLIQDGIITIDDLANMEEIRSLQFTTFTSGPGISTTHIALVDTDFHINTTTGNNIQMLIQGVTQYQFDEGAANFNNNDLTMGTAFIQFTSIPSPGVTGSDTVGRIFMDSGNLNHLSIIRNGSTIDLEAGGFQTPILSDIDYDRFDLDDIGTLSFITNPRADLGIAEWGIWVDNLPVPDILLINVPISMESGLSFNGVTEYTFSATVFDMLGNQLINTSFVEVESTTLPLMRFNRTTAAVGSGNAGEIEFRSGNQIYGEIVVSPTDVGAGDETGTMTLRVASNSFENDFITLTGSTGGAAFSTITLNQMMGGLIDMNSNLINNVLEIRSDAADIADAGFLRMGNGELIAWEASPAGGDHSLTFNANVFEIAISGGADYTFTSTVFDMINNSIEQILHIQDSSQNEQLTFAAAVASAVNQLKITNAATGNGPIFEALGDDTDVDLNLRAKGQGSVVFADTDGFEELLSLVQISGVAQNFVEITNALTALGPTIAAQGQTDVDLNITSKGTGTINLLADANFTGDLVMGDRFQGSQGVDIPGAGTITLGDGNYFDITGNTNIDFMTTTGWQAGSVVVLQFDANSGVNDNTGGPPGNTAAFDLAGNFSASSGDTITVVFDGTFWREISRSVN